MSFVFLTALAEKGAAQLNFVPSNAWTKEYAVRVDRGAPGALDAGDGALHPVTIRLSDGRYRMYYTGYDESGLSRVLSAITSDGGVTWAREPGFRIDGGGVTGAIRVGHKTVTRLSDGRIRMYYDGVYPDATRILSAISSDGLMWEKEPGVRIDIGSPGSFDAIRADGPVVVGLADGSLRLFYRGVDKPISSGGIHRILSAVSADGLNWTKEGLRLDEFDGEGFDRFGVVAGFAIWLPGGALKLFYMAASPIDPFVGPGVRSAISHDGGFTWAKEEGLRLTRGGSGTLDALAISANLAFLPADANDESAGYRIFYTAAGGNPSAFRIISALASVETLTVAIDIRPGTHPNTVKLGSGGGLPVAILSTTTFRAETVDPTTVTLASAPVKLKGRGTPLAALEDVNGDGLLDLLVHISTDALLLTESDAEAVLRAHTTDGRLVTGVDTVRVIP